MSHFRYAAVMGEVLFMRTVYPLFVLLLLSRSSVMESSASALSPSVEILVSASSSMTLYACFIDGTGHDRVDFLGRELCCNGMAEATKQLLEEHNASFDAASSSMFLPQRCLQELAMVPTSTGSSLIEGITYAFVLSEPLPFLAQSKNTNQFLWRKTGMENHLDAVKTISPYHRHSRSLRSSLTDAGSGKDRDVSMQPSLIPLELKATFDSGGGMHRRLHHSFPIVQEGVATDVSNGKTTFFIFVVVPQGMFIDLDDPLEAVTLKAATVVDAPTPSASSEGTRRDFVFTTVDDPDMLVTATLHTAAVCDIEQPAFVSGQHILVWELSVRRTPTALSSSEPVSVAPVVEFATKLHLRYPHPRPSNEEWIDLPRPMMFAVVDAVDEDESILAENLQIIVAAPDWQLEIAERVWVATGKDEDHDVVMGVTIASCLIGVVLMLREISRVSIWDDV